MLLKKKWLHQGVSPDRFSQPELSEEHLDDLYEDTYLSKTGIHCDFKKL